MLGVFHVGTALIFTTFLCSCTLPTVWQWNALFLVMEDHSEVEEQGLQEPRNSIVMVDASSGKEKIIVEHADFFASPRVTQDGLHLVWIQWNHPSMVSECPDRVNSRE